MPFIAHRKIMRHGSSGVIALPPAWRSKNEPGFGDTVTLIYNDVILVIAIDPESRVNLQQLIHDKVFR